MRERRREEILSATLEVLVSHGWSGLRMRDVADLARVSVGTIQYYFDTRDNLLLEACRYETQRSVAGWAQASETAGEGPWPRLEAMVDYFVAGDRFSDRSVLWFEFCAAAARIQTIRTHLLSIYDDWRDPLAHILQEGQQTGEFAFEMPLPELVDMIITHIDGLQIAVVLGAIPDVSYMRHLLIESIRLIVGVSAAAAARSPGLP
jgi:AcrR family transcriptional regulator